MILKKLEKEGLLERVGKTNSQKFILAKDYYIFTETEPEYSNQKPIGEIQIAIILLKHIKEFGKGG